MTQNQVAYQALVENQRHNQAMEEVAYQDMRTKRGLGIASTILNALGLGAKVLSGGRIR